MAFGKRRKSSTKAKTPRKSKSEGKIAHKKTEVDGITFDSKMEASYYVYLKELIITGEVLTVELQPDFILQNKFIIVEGVAYPDTHEDFAKLKRKHKVETIRAIKYISDFKVTYKDGSIAIIDTKGIETTDFKIKEKLFRARYPQLNLRIIIKHKGEWIKYSLYKKLKAEAKKLKK